MVYKDKRSFMKSTKNNTPCLSCNRKGDKNPFYGKKHTKDSMLKMVETSKNSEKRKEYYNKIKTEEFRKQLSEKFKGSDNPNYNRGYYKSWVEKYGVEVANDMMTEFKKIQSLSSSGENNPMFGKPSPKKSGNGWGGWYKDFYFRSLLELSYLINIIERFNINWESGEQDKYKIQYEIDGKKRNYFPDFILNNKYIIECKPKKLWNTQVNSIKRKYAEEFCSMNGFKFKMVEPKKISFTELEEMIKNGEIILNEKYTNRFNKLILNK